MWNLDGVVVIGFCEDEYQDLRDRIRVPFVIYDGFLDEQNRFGNLTIDDFDGGRQAGQYLKEMGHRRVLCVADNEICMDYLRYQGLCEGWGAKADFMKIPMQAAERELFYQERLATIKTYTAIFAVSDVYALELMRFLQKNGVRIPDELSLIGFDGSREAQNALPKLTTVAQNNALRARTAIHLLMEMINGETDAKTVCIPVRLWVGDSVKNLTKDTENNDLRKQDC